MNTLLSENVSYVRRGNVEKSAAISGFTSAGIYIDSNILNNKAEMFLFGTYDLEFYERCVGD